MSNQAETEITLFCGFNNSDGFDQAKYREDHLQYEAKLGQGKSRIRVTNHFPDRVAGDSLFTQQPIHQSCVFTIKTKTTKNGLDSNREFNQEVDEAFKDVFIGCCDYVQQKSRFVFESDPVELLVNDKTFQLKTRLKYEIDVFYSYQNPSQAVELCKIDVELDELLQEIESLIEFNQLNLTDEEKQSKLQLGLTLLMKNLPFEPVDLFIASEATPAQRKQLDQLYDEHINKPLNKIEG
jgi:hypothetical protein